MGITNLPQNICPEAWYYENKGSIDIIINPQDSGFRVITPRDINKSKHKARGIIASSNDGFHLRIPSRMLLATLKRQGRR